MFSYAAFFTIFQFKHSRVAEGPEGVVTGITNTNTVQNTMDRITFLSLISHYLNVQLRFILCAFIFKTCIIQSVFMRFNEEFQTVIKMHAAIKGRGEN